MNKDHQIHRRVIRQTNAQNYPPGRAVIPPQQQQQQPYNMMRPVQRQNRKAPTYYHVQSTPSITAYHPAPAVHYQQPQARPVYYQQQPQPVYYYPITTPAPEPEEDDKTKLQRKKPVINTLLTFLTALKLSLTLYAADPNEPFIKPKKVKHQEESSEESEEVAHY